MQWGTTLQLEIFFGSRRRQDLRGGGMWAHNFIGQQTGAAINLVSIELLRVESRCPGISKAHRRIDHAGGVLFSRDRHFCSLLQ
jgi:hypothetical protein